MRKGLAVLFVAAVMVAVGLVGQPRESEAAFHFMRVYGVMGGAFNDTDYQYVELRMTTGGQNLVMNHDICFYDDTGAPYAKFRFPTDAPSSTNLSILIGSTEFDTAWTVGSPDYFFNGSTVTAIASGADVNHPVRLPNGKVSFGTDTATMPAAMCQASFTPNLIDSVAYGLGYTGTVDYGTKFNTDMPSTGTSAVRLTGPVCTPGFNCAPMYTRNNSVDYSILDVNVTINNPRNNAGLSGPLSGSAVGVGGVGGIPDTATPLGGSGNGLTMFGLLALGIVPAVLGVFWLRRRRLG